MIIKKKNGELRDCCVKEIKKKNGKKNTSKISALIFLL